MLASGDVRDRYVGGVLVQVAVEDALNHPEHVGSGQDDAGGAEDRPADVVGDGGLHGAREDEEFADEAAEHWKADDGQGGDDEESYHPGELGCEAPVVAHVVGAVALVEDAQQDKEGSSTDAFVEGGVDAAVEPGDGEGEDAEDDDADVSERSVGG